MKSIAALLMFIIWCIATIALAISIIGILAVMMLDEESVWLSIPNQCIKAISES